MKNRSINSKQLIYKDFDIELIRSSRKSIAIEIKYSLQGTTQGRYLTGGVPPVRFSM